jgi:hypothetical protein
VNPDVRRLPLVPARGLVEHDARVRERFLGVWRR